MTTLVRPAPTAHSAAIPVAFADPACRVNPVVRAALFLFVLSIPFEIPHRGDFPLEVPTVTGLLFIASTILNPTACYRRFPAALGWIAAWVWILAASMYVNNTFQTELALKMLAQYVVLILLVWPAYNVLADPAALKGVLLAMVIGGVARAAVQVLRIGTTDITVWTGGDRVTFMGQNLNLSAMIMSASMAAIVGLHTIRAKGLPRFGPLTWAFAGLIGLAIIQTGSRGGLIGVGLGLAVFWFRGRTLFLRVRNGVVGLIAAGALGWGAMHAEVMRNRLEESAGEGKLAGRERIYPAAIQMWLEKPVLGWGPVDNQFEIAKRIQDPLHQSRDVHNLVLELLTTTGVVGAIPYLIGLTLVIRSAWRARRGALGVLPLGVLVATLAGCISGTWIESKILCLAITLSLAAGTFWARPLDRRERWA